MPAFDTAITPVAVTPANTSNATLFTASADTSVLVNAVNVGTTNGVTINIGIDPSGGTALFNIIDDGVLDAGQSYLSLGPFFLQNGDAVVVQTDDADEITFSLTGVESS
jgi:hypothetical protein